MGKKILIAILILILGLGGAILYLNAVYLPAKLKATIVSNLEKRLNAKVSLESLKYNLLKGIVINNLAIYETATQEQKPFLTVKEISFNLLYLPLFKNKTIIIPSLRIDSPQINIIRLNQNAWNFDYLLAKAATSPQPDFSFLVYKVSVLHAKIFFTDRALSPTFSKTIPEINGRAQLSLPRNIKFNLEGRLSEKSVSSLMILKGDLDLNQQLLTANLNLHDIDFLQFQPYYNFPFNLKSGLAKEANLKIAAQKNRLAVSGRIEAKNLAIDKAPYNIKGDCLIQTNVSVNPVRDFTISNGVNPQQLTYDGSIEIADAAITGDPLLQNINQIKGIINFNEQGIQTDNLEGISHQTILRAKGTITDFANPRIEAKIFSSPTLERLREIFSDRLKEIDFETKGRTQLILEITGPLNDATNLVIRGNADIADANLAVPQLPQPLKDISGQVTFDKDSLRWRKLSADYSGTTYICEGFVNNFANPHLELTVGSKMLSLSTKLDIQEKILKLSQWQGKYLNSAFDFKGNADLNHPQNPILDLTGKVQLDLPDLAQFLPFYKSSLEAIKPLGSVILDVILQGKLNNWKQWLLSVVANSPQISLQGLKLHNLNLIFSQQDEAIKNLALTAAAYSGNIEIFGNAGLSEDALPGEMNLNIKDIDLAQLKMDTPWKEKPTSGKLSLSAQVKGPFKNTKALRGNGSLMLTEGNLWELNLLRGLSSLLFIPEFEKIVFKEAGGDFIIENGLIYTSNLEAKSNEMNLAGEGSVDFSGNLDFTLNAQLNQDLIQNSPSLKKSITQILSSASGAIIVKLTGNVQKPKYKIVPAAGDIIKRVKEFLLEDILR